MKTWWYKSSSMSPGDPVSKTSNVSSQSIESGKLMSSVCNDGNNELRFERMYVRRSGNQVELVETISDASMSWSGPSGPHSFTTHYKYK